MSRPPPPHNLPSLAFGNDSQRTFTGLHEFGEALEGAGYVVRDLSIVRSARGLAAAVACVNLPAVTLLAVSSSSHCVVTERAGRVSLCFCGDGAGRLSAGGASAPYHRAAAAFTPASSVEWRIDEFASDFEVAIDEARLGATARNMLCCEASAPIPGLNLDHLRTIPMRAGVVDGRSTLLNLAILANRYRSQPRVLEASGIEDQCLRHAVLLLLPDAFQRARSAPASLRSERPAIDRLCEWLRANLGSPITLSDMERQTSLSSRALQLNFRKQHGMSPLEWLREQRLLAAHDLLVAAGGQAHPGTVNDVAEWTGFGSLLLMHRWYVKRFGETPRATLRRGKQ
jgi:AraC-like DNA-binding protein